MDKLLTAVKSELKRLLKNKKSETSKARGSLSVFCTGDGIDIGYGGDPIVRNAICMDMPNAYAKYKKNPQHLHGDAKDLTWFRDESLDFIYSSHVLEDFADTLAVLQEWLRVLRIGGNLILFCPDEQLYRKDCLKRGKPRNHHHIHENFNLEYVKKLLSTRKDVQVVHERFPVGVYSFELVAKKIDAV